MVVRSLAAPLCARLLVVAGWLRTIRESVWALFLASLRTRDLFSSLILSQSRFRFISSGMMLSSSLGSLGAPRKGLVVTLYRLIIPMVCSTTSRVPLIHLLRASSPSVGPRSACRSQAAPSRLPYGGAEIVSRYALVSLVHVQGRTVRLGRIDSGHDPGQHPEVRRVFLE